MMFALQGYGYDGYGHGFGAIPGPSKRSKRRAMFRGLGLDANGNPVIDVDYECHPSKLAAVLGEVMCSPLNASTDAMFRGLQQMINNAAKRVGVSKRLVVDGILGPASTQLAVMVFQKQQDNPELTDPKGDLAGMIGCATPSGVCGGELARNAHYYTVEFGTIAGSTVAAPVTTSTASVQKAIQKAGGLPPRESASDLIGLQEAGPSTGLIVGMALGALALVGAGVAAVAYRRRQQRRRGRRAHAF